MDVLNVQVELAGYLVAGSWPATCRFAKNVCDIAPVAEIRFRFLDDAIIQERFHRPPVSSHRPAWPRSS